MAGGHFESLDLPASFRSISWSQFIKPCGPVGLVGLLHRLQSLRFVQERGFGFDIIRRQIEETVFGWCDRTHGIQPFEITVAQRLVVAQRQKSFSWGADSSDDPISR